MSPRIIRKLHRWLGLLFSISVLMASGSGVIHNIMTRTQAPPPQAKPSGGGMDVKAIQLTVADAIQKLGGSLEILAVNLRGINNQPWYQIYVKNVGKPQYVSAVDGRVDPAQDELYAAEIAKNFLAGAAVEKTDFLTAFNMEYLNIFRILPVYRFDTKDKLQTRVYVSTTTGSVTRHTDRERQFEATIFTMFHKFGFIPNKNIRDLVLTILTLGTFLVALLGIWLFFATRPRKA